MAVWIRIEDATGMPSSASQGDAHDITVLDSSAASRRPPSVLPPQSRACPVPAVTGPTQPGGGKGALEPRARKGAGLGSGCSCSPTRCWALRASRTRAALAPRDTLNPRCRVVVGGRGKLHGPADIGDGLALVEELLSGALLADDLLRGVVLVFHGASPG